jgi:hypothetical protein
LIDKLNQNKPVQLDLQLAVPTVNAFAYDDANSFLIQLLLDGESTFWRLELPEQNFTQIFKMSAGIPVDTVQITV